MGTPCSWWKHTGGYSPFVDGISSPILRNIENSELCPSNKLPIGALYAARKAPDGSNYYSTGPDGLTIFCVLPGNHHWCIDARASNCTMPGDTQHRCWIRHGTFGEKLTVDKNGETCQAGGGSIAVSGYHGFLRNGELVP